MEAPPGTVTTVNAFILSLAEAETICIGKRKFGAAVVGGVRGGGVGGGGVRGRGVRGTRVRAGATSIVECAVPDEMDRGANLGGMAEKFTVLPGSGVAPLTTSWLRGAFDTSVAGRFERGAKGADTILGTF